ncbi:MAG: HAD-IA family hydrolase, partial [Planctomycetes bacterium]|nr:HAD-IA family hydrolase [Planctomycetota bacterium]
QTMIDWHGLRDSWEALRCESNELFIRVLADELAPLPGLFPLLDALEAAGIPRAIATSSDRELLDACLAPFDLRHRFEFALTSEDVTRGKPHPEVYLQAAARFGVSPSQTVVFEDSQNGCRAAHAAGAFTIAVPGPHSRTHDFSGASLVVTSLADPALYAALNLRSIS